MYNPEDEFGDTFESLAREQRDRDHAAYEDRMEREALEMADVAPEARVEGQTFVHDLLASIAAARMNPVHAALNDWMKAVTPQRKPMSIAGSAQKEAA